MKRKIFTLLSAAIVSTTSLFAQFTAGKIVVTQVGDASLAVNSGHAVTVVEFNTDGTPTGYTVAIPSTGPSRLVLPRSFMGSTLSADRNRLIIGGFDAAVGTTAVPTSADIPRVINAVSYDGTVTRVGSGLFAECLPTALRGVTASGLNFWAGGQGSSALNTTGVMKLNNTDAALSIAGEPSSGRALIIQNGQMYLSTGVAVNGDVGVFKIGNGTPTGSGAAQSLVVATTGIGTGTASPYAFAFNSANSICYIADDRSSANGGGVMKFTSVNAGATWTYQYTINTATSTPTPAHNVGVRSLIVDWSTTNPTIYATTAASQNNRLLKIEDQGASTAAVVLSVAPASNYYNAVMFAPENLPMPVKWNDNAFNVKLIEAERAEVLWQTLQEINTSHFIIEKSTDGVGYEKIGTVNAAGYSSYAKNYSFIDANAAKGKSYYRIQQVDKDGSSAYSKIIVLNNNGKIKSSLMQNPVRNEVRLKVAVSDLGNAYTVNIMDVNGKKLMSKNLSVENAAIPVQSLKSGNYIAQIIGKNGVVQSLLFVKD